MQLAYWYVQTRKDKTRGVGFPLRSPRYLCEGEMEWRVGEKSVVVDFGGLRVFCLSVWDSGESSFLCTVLHNVSLSKVTNHHRIKLISFHFISFHC